MGHAIRMPAPLMSGFLLARINMAVKELAVLFSKPIGEDARTQADIHSTAARLLNVHGNSIYRLAYSYLHNASDAEKVVQDTLVRFLTQTPEFSDTVHEKAWCLRVAGNLAKNRIRYNRVRDADELCEELAAEQRDDLSFVWEAVKALPVKYREVIHLFYHEELTTAEIAAVLQRKETTVRSELSRGREKLKGILEEFYDFG